MADQSALHHASEANPKKKSGFCFEARSATFRAPGKGYLGFRAGSMRAPSAVRFFGREVTPSKNNGHARRTRWR